MAGVVATEVCHVVAYPPLCTCMHLLLQIAGQKSQTAVMPNTRSPIYNSHSEFFHLQLHDTLTVQVGRPRWQGCVADGL